MKNRIVCLMGPTATGKTDLALELVKKFPVEIISVDSAMVYRGLNIGSGKPSSKVLDEIPHHLVDIRSPSEKYSVSTFINEASNCIEEIIARGKIPLLVGGTMLYFNKLLTGINSLPCANDEVRASINLEAEKKGWPAMHASLAAVDSISAEKIHPNDSKRIQRALEVYKITGLPKSQYLKNSFRNESITDKYVISSLALMPQDRTVLHKRIEDRFDNMLEAGFLSEVEELYKDKRLSIDLPSIRSVGYRQAWDFFEGNCSHAVMREKAIAATRQLAKRQITWLRSFENVTMLSCGRYCLNENFKRLTDSLAI